MLPSPNDDDFTLIAEWGNVTVLTRNRHPAGRLYRLRVGKSTIGGNDTKALVTPTQAPSLEGLKKIARVYF
jgi:hypothetical protein